LAWRYASGARLDGQPHTSSSAWARMPRWKRAAWRVGTPAVLLAADLTHAAHPLAVDAALAGLGVVGARAVRRRWRMRRFTRMYTRPTLAALRPALGDAPIHLYVDPSLGTLATRLVRPMSPAEVAVRTWYGAHLEPALRWGPDRMQRAAWTVQGWVRPVTAPIAAALRRPTEQREPRIELRLAVPYLTVEQQQYVESVIAAKLPAGELVKNFDQVGPHVTAVWKVRRRPPATVGYADLDARFTQLAEWEFFLGLGVGGRQVVVSLHDDSPHLAISAGSGAGKSVLAQLVAAQVLARGGLVTILDIKGSHRWALGMPGVDYCTTPEQMHRALLRLDQLALQRNQASLFESEGWDPGPRHLIVAEELNATVSRMRDWWEDAREPGQPKASPAIKAHRSISAMGRSAKVNEIAIAQMLSANASGGPEARENYGIRCLARYTKNNWQMLCPGTSMPRASRTLGRWQIVRAGEAIETQVCYLTTAQVRLFVAKHRTGVHVPALTLDGPLTRNVHVDVDSPAPLTLQESIDEGVCPWPLATVQKRLQRARAAGRPTPISVGKRLRADLYERAALIAWYESELIP